MDLFKSKLGDWISTKGKMPDPGKRLDPPGVALDSNPPLTPLYSGIARNVRIWTFAELCCSNHCLSQVTFAHKEFIMMPSLLNPPSLPTLHRRGWHHETSGLYRTLHPLYTCRKPHSSTPRTPTPTTSSLLKEGIPTMMIRRTQKE